MMQNPQFHPDHRAEELYPMVLDLVRDFAPRNVSLGHTEAMADSIVTQIVHGIHASIVPMPHPQQQMPPPNLPSEFN